MRHRFTALLLSPLAACSGAVQAQARIDPPVLAREFRAAWVATVNNIDWPSRPGLSTAAARSELDAIVARAAELRLNALVFQVRPAGDAFYASRREPWSEWLTGAQGRAPDEAWDPLEHVIGSCHRAGLQLHAWFNPYRAAHPSARSGTSPGHVLEKLPSACVRYGAYMWMDPGDERAAAWTLAVIEDVVARYDVDGVHIDDYFYPYPEKGLQFPDQRTFAAYRQAGGKLGLSDWRRANIDTFVQRLYAVVHQRKPWVQVGISPFGIARPGVPRGIQAGIDQYDQLYADVPRWLREGWVDYLAPQLYWPIDQAPQSFAVLLPWWQHQNPRQRHVWPGLNAGRALEGKTPWRRDELADQIAAVRATSTAPGHVLYSFRALRSEAANVGGALRTRLYRELAIPPASTWLGAAAPDRPSARVETAGGRRIVRWQPDPDARFVAIQVEGPSGWRTQAIVGAQVAAIGLPHDATAVAVTAIGRTGIASKQSLPAWP